MGNSMCGAGQIGIGQSVIACEVYDRKELNSG